MLSCYMIDIEADKDTLLDFHCRINYESESLWRGTLPFEQYRLKWLSTSQTKTFIRDLDKSMVDQKPIADIWEDVHVVGYLWVTFFDLFDYNLTTAEVRDIAVAADYQRSSVGRKMLAHVEQLARDRGAHLLRSETGINNVASQKLHMSFASQPYRIQYEKLLAEEKLILDKAFYESR